VIADSLGGGEEKTSNRTMEEWDAPLDEFAYSSAFAKAENCFVNGGREGIY
jgi:hypothetical protein